MMKFTWNILMSIGYEVTNEKQPLTYLSVLTYDIAIGKQTLTCFSFISMLMPNANILFQRNNSATRFPLCDFLFIFKYNSFSYVLYMYTCTFFKNKTYKKVRSIKSRTKYILQSLKEFQPHNSAIITIINLSKYNSKQHKMTY